MKDVQNRQQPEIMSRAEAAEYLRISIRKLDYLADAGELKLIKLGEGKRSRVLYRRKDIDEFITSNLVSDRKEAAKTARKAVGRGRI